MEALQFLIEVDNEYRNPGVVFPSVALGRGKGQRLVVGSDEMCSPGG